MWKCPYCSKELERKSKYTESGHLSRCKDWLTWRDKTLTKEVLEKLYVDRKMSMPEIAEYFNLSSCGAIDRKLKIFGIKARTLSETANSKRTKEKKAKTMLKRYGVEHNLHSDSPIRKQMVSDLVEKYGVTNVFQLDSVKEKSRVTLKEKYGVDSAWELSLVGLSYTKPHKYLVDNLEMWGYTVEIEYKLVCENNVYFVDIYIEPDIIIEVYGDYWHGNPLFYTEDDIVLRGSSGEYTVGEKWQSDALRISNIRNQGYRVIVVWEHDLYNSLDSIKGLINEYTKDSFYKKD